MKKPIIAGYIISLFFCVWSIIVQNYEFLAYAAAVIIVLVLIHFLDKKFQFHSGALLVFDAWMVLHFLGGLAKVSGDALYNLMLIPIVGEPYLILKYDQVVHTLCYFAFTLLMLSVVTSITKKNASFGVVVFLAIMAATGIGGLNEIIEFSTTLFFDNNVGGYENTALDIVSNLVGALIAIPFCKMLYKKK